MCGICAIAHRGLLDVRPSLERMIASLLHRGPDGDGAVYLPDCALGHARLSIIDRRWPRTSRGSHIKLWATPCGCGSQRITV